MKQHIKLDKGKLIFIERMPLWYPKENNTLEKENQVTVGLRETMEALLRAGYSVSWDIIGVPLLVSLTEWLDAIRESHERCHKPESEVLEGFFHDATSLISGSLKYTTLDETNCVNLNQSLFIIVARPHIPPGSQRLSVRRFAFSFNGSSNRAADWTDKKRKCTLKLTPEMKQYVTETLPEMIQRSFGRLDWTKENRRAEWWGTVHAEKWISIDSSRIPRNRLNFFS
ncbi:hypothetical protein FBUS_06627 [Fasciolopsis buskii]|uniref:Uncharacterized protein n=1 Tax=Fasciolopsis buskii TaxID=27845 RepID=A0A8E0RTW4_9TREM|nr:hypothetical protein FBUS_06627 [Fasciolopsis buski]